MPTPEEILAANPYMAQLIQPPQEQNWMSLAGQILANIGGGFLQSNQAGTPWQTGLGQGAMMATQGLAQGEAERRKQAMGYMQYAQQEMLRQAQIAEIRSKIAERDKLAAARGAYVAPSFGGGQPVPTDSTIAGGGGPPPDLEATGKQYANYLLGQYGPIGMTPTAAGAIAGGLGWESRFNPTQIHDGGRGYGFAGWDPQRTAGLKAFAASRGKSEADPYTQLDYVVHEFQRGDMGAQRAWALLQQARTPEEATTAMMHFFRPEGYTPSNPTAGLHYPQRVQYSTRFTPQGTPPTQQAGPAQPGSITIPQFGGTGPDVPAAPGPWPGLGPRAVPPQVAMAQPYTGAQGSADDIVAPGLAQAQSTDALAGGAGSDQIAQVQLPPMSIPGLPPRQAPMPSTAAQQPLPVPPVAAAPTQGPYATEPPKPRVVPEQGLTPEERAYYTWQVRTGQITEEKAGDTMRDIVRDRNKVAREQAKDTYERDLKIWENQQKIEEANRTHERTMKEKDVWSTPSEEERKRFMMKPDQTYMINRATGEVKSVGQPLVTIDQRGREAFTEAMGKYDAERFGKIIDAEGRVNDVASKINYALGQFRETYTGPGAQNLVALNRILGSLGVEGAAKAANAADAGMAVISEMKPQMRAAGSGSTSDFEMDTFGRALPALINLPGGNEKIAAYFQRIADRATRIRELAQVHSKGGKEPLTGTGFDDEVKKIGPLFTKEQLEELNQLGKTKPTDRQLQDIRDKYGLTPKPAGG